MAIRLLIVFATLLCFGHATHTQNATTSAFGLRQFDPSVGTWMEDPDAPHTYSKPVTGDAAHGHWIMYVKIDPGAWINWHWHSNPQSMYGVSGTMEYEIKPAPKFRFGPGSYAVVPGHALHNGTCVSKEPCYFFIENILPNDKHMTDENGVERSGKRSEPS